MKRGLPFLLLAIAAVGAFSVSAASGSVLCKVNETPCSSANVVKTNSPFTAVWQVSLGSNYVCSPSSLFGAVRDVGDEGKSAWADGSNLAFACKKVSPAAECFLWVENDPYDLEFEGSEGDGTMILSDPVELKFSLSCGFPPKVCTLSTKEPIGFEFTGGTPAVMAVTNAPVSSGEGCPTTVSMELKTGTASTPENLFIVGGPAPLPRLCEVNTSPCPEPNRYPIGTAIEGTLEGDSVFEFLYEGKKREPACGGGAITAKTTQAAIPLFGEVSAMSFSSCGGGVCAVEAQSLPYGARIERTTGGNGTLALVGGGSGPPKVEVNCGGAFKCIYRATSVSLSVTGGNPAKLGVAATLEKDPASEAECGASMVWKATYQLTKPAPLFVT